MPNHVTTRLVVSPEVADALTRTPTPDEYIEHELAEVQRKAWTEKQIEDGRSVPEYVYRPLDMDKRHVDFELVIPTPERMFHGNCNMQHPHPHPDGGFYDDCWSDWQVENWGTKWNAYDSRVKPIEGDLCEVVFDTAWAFPFPVIFELSRRFPQETIKAKYADEDLGSNLGEFEIRGGKIVWERQFDYGSPEALDFASQLKYGISYAELVSDR